MTLEEEIESVQPTDEEIEEIFYRLQDLAASVEKFKTHISDMDISDQAKGRAFLHSVSEVMSIFLIMISSPDTWNDTLDQIKEDLPIMLDGIGEGGEKMTDVRKKLKKRIQEKRAKGSVSMKVELDLGKFVEQLEDTVKKAVEKGKSSKEQLKNAKIRIELIGEEESEDEGDYWGAPE